MDPETGRWLVGAWLEHRNGEEQTRLLRDLSKVEKYNGLSRDNFGTVRFCSVGKPRNRVLGCNQ